MQTSESLAMYQIGRLRHLEVGRRVLGRRTLMRSDHLGNDHCHRILIRHPRRRQCILGVWEVLGRSRWCREFDSMKIRLQTWMPCECVQQGRRPERITGSVTQPDK